MALPITVSSSKAARMASAREFLPAGYVPSNASSASRSSGVAKFINSAADQISSLKGIAQANSAWNAQQAAIQRQWQEAQNAKAMQFNAQEAAKNRDWQKMMSNTAHQREVKDLMAAGLNPVLSAMNGNGAAVGSGATASGVTSAGAKGEADTSTSGAIANLLGSILAAQTQIEAANINARTQQSVADTYTAMERIVAGINQASTLGAAGIGASATRYSADQHLKGAYATAGASRYASDTQRFLAANYPSSMYGFISALAGSIADGDGISSAVDVGKSLLEAALGGTKRSSSRGNSGRTSGGFSNKSVGDVLKGLLR